MAKVAIQGGVKNYLGNQKTVGKVPIKWKSGPDHPETELAYITKAEKDLLLKKDLHNSLNGKPNRGPEGLMSLNGWGDASDGFGSDGVDSGNSNDQDNSGYSGNDNSSYQNPKLPPAVQKAVDEGKKTSVVTKEDEKKAAADAKVFQNKLKVQKKKKALLFKLNKEKLKKLLAEKKIEDAKKVGESKNPFARFASWNKNSQLEANKNLARKLAFQKYQDVEQYVTPFDEYGLSAEQLAAKVAANNTYGYDFEEDIYGNKIDKGMKTLGSNIGTNIEKYRDNLYDVTSSVPFSLASSFFNKIRPDTQVTAENTLNKARDYNSLVTNPDLTRNMIMDLGNRGRTEEQIRFLENPPNTGSENILPFIPKEDTEEDTEEDNQEVDYTQNVIYEDYGKPGYRTTRAAEGGIMGTRARRAMGGIMERVDKRQGYFLGKLVSGIGDAIGGVADAAGKVLKSDLGKYAIMAAGMYYGGGGASVFKTGGGGFMNGLKAMGSNFMSTKNPLLFTNGKLSLGKLAGISTVLPFLMPAAKPNETSFSDRGGSLIDPLTGEEATPAEMRENIELAKLEAGNDPDKLAAIDQKYNNMLNLKYHANLPDATPYLGYGESGYRTTAATGGRMGFNNGGTTITLMDGTTVKIPSGSYNSSGSLKDKIYSSSKGDLLREEIVRKLTKSGEGKKE